METSPALNAGEKILSSSHGTVQVRDAVSGEWKPAISGMRLEEGMAIRTLRDGQAEVLLPRNWVVRLESDSYMEFIPRYPVKTLGDFLRLIKGEFWLKIKKPLPGRFDVETPNAIGGVKGTEFVVIVNDTGTMVNVIEGVVEVSTLNGTGNVSVGVNQRTVVPAGGVPGGPVSFDPATTDRWWTQFPPLPDEAWTASPSPAATPAKQSPAPGLLAGALAIATVVFLLRQRRGP